MLMNRNNSEVISFSPMKRYEGINSRPWSDWRSHGTAAPQTAPSIITTEGNLSRIWKWHLLVFKDFSAVSFCWLCHNNPAVLSDSRSVLLKSPAGSTSTADSAAVGGPVAHWPQVGLLKQNSHMWFVTSFLFFSGLPQISWEGCNGSVTRRTTPEFTGAVALFAVLAQVLCKARVALIVTHLQCTRQHSEAVSPLFWCDPCSAGGGATNHYRSWHRKTEKERKNPHKKSTLQFSEYLNQANKTGRHTYWFSLFTLLKHFYTTLFSPTFSTIHHW